MGLLDKALTLETEGEKHVKNASPFSPDISSLFDTISADAKALDFPSVLFSRIIEALKIEKGALLLADENGRYVPWAVQGFDQTTSRRIRIPETLLTTLNNRDRYTFVELKDAEIDLLKDFFSFREYSVTKSVLIAPIKSEELIIGLLFISEGAFLLRDYNLKKEILNQLSESAGLLLESRRQNIVSKLENLPDGRDDIKDILYRNITKDRDKPFLLLTVSVDELISLIHSRDKGAIDFRIMQDIHRLVKTLIGDRGEVAAKDSKSFFVCLDSSRNEEAELFIHQIGLSLGYFFKVDSSSFKPLWDLVAYPADGATAEDLLKHLK